MSGQPINIEPRPSLEAVRSLLAAAELPTSDITDAHLDHFFSCGSPGAPKAIAGVELYGDVALLRSVVVSPDMRASGFGSALVEHVESYARQSGARALYLLTTTAESFFSRLGYQKVDRSEAPASIRATREFSDICPASSAFMSKEL